MDVSPSPCRCETGFVAAAADSSQPPALSVSAAATPLERDMAWVALTSGPVTRRVPPASVGDWLDQAVPQADGHRRINMPMAPPLLDVALTFLRDRRLPHGLSSQAQATLADVSLRWDEPALHEELGVLYPLREAARAARHTPQRTAALLELGNALMDLQRPRDAAAVWLSAYRAPSAYSAWCYATGSSVDRQRSFQQRACWALHANVLDLVHGRADTGLRRARQTLLKAPALAAADPCLAALQAGQAKPLLRHVRPDTRDGRGMLGPLPPRDPVTGAWTTPGPATECIRVNVRGTLSCIDGRRLRDWDDASVLRLMLGADPDWRTNLLEGRPFLDLGVDAFAALRAFVHTGCLPNGMSVTERALLAQDADYLGLRAVRIESKQLYILRRQVAAAPSATLRGLALLRLGNELYARGAHDDAHACWQRAARQTCPEALAAAVDLAFTGAAASMPERQWMAYHLAVHKLLQQGFCVPLLGLLQEEEAHWPEPVPLRRLRAYIAWVTLHPRAALAHLQVLADTDAAVAAILQAPAPPGSALRDTVRARVAAVAAASADDLASAVLLAHLEQREGARVDTPALTALLTRAPRSVYAQRRWIQTPKVQQNDPTTLASLQAVVHAHPVCFDAYVWLLKHHLVHAKWADVRALTAARARMRPHEAVGMAAHGAALAATGEPVSGIVACRRAQQMDGADPLVLLACAIAYQAAGRTPEAVTAALGVLRFEHRDATLVLRACQALGALGRRTMAIEFLRAFIGAYGGSPALLLGMVELLRAECDYPGILYYTEMLHRLAPHDGAHARLHFDALIDSHHPGRAQRFAARALPAPLAPPQATRLAACWWHHRQHHKAQAVLRELVARQPDDAHAWLWLSRCEHALGALGRARDALAMAAACGAPAATMACVHVEQLLAERRFAEARAAADALLQAHPDHAPGYACAAKAYDATGQPAQIEATVQALAAAAPAARAFLAGWMMAQGRTLEAAASYRRLLQEGFSPADMQLGLARCLSDLGAQAASVNLLEQAARAQPAAPQAFFEYAVALLQANELASAAAWATKACHQLDDARSFGLRGDILVAQQQWRAAADMYRHAIMRDPSDALARTAYAEVRLRQQRIGSAIRYAESAIACDPKNGRAWAVLAVARTRLSVRDPAALQAARNAKELGNRSAQLATCIARLMAAYNQHMLCRRWLRKAVARAPDEALPRRDLALHLEHDGHFAEAAEVWEAAIARAGADLSLIECAAYCWARAGHFGPAQRGYETLLAHDPGHLSAQKSLAAILLREPADTDAFARGLGMLRAVLQHRARNGREQLLLDVALYKQAQSQPAGASASAVHPRQAGSLEDVLAFAGVLAEQGEYRLAEQWLVAASGRFDDSLPRKESLMCMRIETGGDLRAIDTAVSPASAAAVREPADFEALVHLCVLHGDERPAVAAFADALRRWPSDARVLRGAALLQSLCHRPRLAQALCRVAAQRHPRDAGVIADSLLAAYNAGDAAMAIRWGRARLHMPNASTLDAAALVWGLRSGGHWREALGWAQAYFPAQLEHPDNRLLGQELCATLLEARAQAPV